MVDEAGGARHSPAAARAASPLQSRHERTQASVDVSPRPQRGRPAHLDRPRPRRCRFTRRGRSQRRRRRGAGVRSRAPARRERGRQRRRAGIPKSRQRVGHSEYEAGSTTAFTGDRAETERLLAFDKAIQLTAAQEKVRLEALTPMAAPCCKHFSAATCCCRCNMMRARDGLAKHLIADLGLDATTVRAQVSAWHQAINPDGFTGDSCSTGQCGHAFADNGCGGMADGQLVF